MSEQHAADPRDDPARRGAGADARRGAADRRARDASRSRRPTAACCARRRGRPGRAAVRARGHGRLRRRRRGHLRRRPVRAAGRCSRVEKVYTGQVPTRSVSRGECVEIATGAPMPDGADAVVMVEETEKDEAATVRVFSPVYPGQNVGRQGADIRGRPGAARAGRLPDAEPRRRDRGARHRPGRGLRPAARGDPLDRQRDRRARPRARAGPDLRHQPVHAGRHRRGARRRAGALPDGRPTRSTTSTARSTPRSPRTSSIFSGGSSVGERDLILDAIAARGRGPVPRHRGEAGQADAVRRRSAASRSSGCPATRPRACRTATCCWCRCSAAGAPARARSRAPVRLPLGQRVVSTTGRHQFYTVRDRGRRRRCRPSRRRATSPACRRPTATSRSRRRPTSSRRVRLVDVKSVLMLGWPFGS